MVTVWIWPLATIYVQEISVTCFQKGIVAWHQYFHNIYWCFGSIFQTGFQGRHTCGTFQQMQLLQWLKTNAKVSGRHVEASNLYLVNMILYNFPRHSGVKWDEINKNLSLDPEIFHITIRKNTLYSVNIIVIYCKYNIYNLHVLLINNVDFLCICRFPRTSDSEYSTDRYCLHI